MINYRLIQIFLLLALAYFTPFQLAKAQWTKAVSNTANNLFDVKYANGQWIAVGDNGTILTSLDAATWTPQSSNTTQTLRAVLFAGGQWIAAGGGGTILTSPNGTAWTLQSTGTKQDFTGITYGAGLYIAVGSTGVAMTSPDGITWTSSQASQLQLFSISYGAGLFVAVGESRLIVTSPDGITWTSRSSNLPGGGLCGCLYPTLFGISFADGKFVTIGGLAGGGALASSPDGITWTRGSGVQQSSTVGFGAGLWLAFSIYGTIHTSTNGLTWSSRYHPDNRRSLFQANYGGGLWVAVGYRGEIQYGIDANAPMPVSLISFTAEAEDNTSHLRWETAWERGASHFLIERSRDAKSFEPIGQVSAEGTTNINQHYSFVDKGLTGGIWYYRLRQMDFDETFTHSSIVAVRIGNEPLETLALSPNPGTGPMALEYKGGITSVLVYSTTGALLQQNHFEQAVERWSWNSAGQPAGTYMVLVQTLNGKTNTVRWVKQ